MITLSILTYSSFRDREGDYVIGIFCGQQLEFHIERMIMHRINEEESVGLAKPSKAIANHQELVSVGTSKAHDCGQELNRN